MVMMLPITINVLTFYSDSNVKEHLRHLHFPQICAHKIHGHLWIKNQKMGQITSVVQVNAISMKQNRDLISLLNNEFVPCIARDFELT